jgi:hypothetical protein
MVFGLNGCAQEAADQQAIELTDAQVEEIVRRSYQYVAMYNVNNKFALDPSNPMSVGGWNRLKVNTALADHTMKMIARPNNDTLYIGAMLDLRAEPVIMSAPAFDSQYVSLMVTGYDHYVNVPTSTRLGDFSTPSRILFYTARTRGYSGEPVPGVDKIVEMTGDFVSAIYRVMPHVNEPDRLQRILYDMRSVEVLTLAEFQQGSSGETNFSPLGSPRGVQRNLDTKFADVAFPDFGQTDFDVFENNLLEVMQFVFNHTTFDPTDALDQSLISVYAPLGVAPGRQFDPAAVADIDGKLFREVAESVAAQAMGKAMDPAFSTDFDYISGLFLLKGQIDLEKLIIQSVIGPIGLPAKEAMYPPIVSMDGRPMNAQYDYVIRMQKNELPPTNAFWSVTLYDTENGFFLPNDRKKYSVGENSGYELDADGGIAIFIAAEKPDGVPEENWLPTNRGHYGIDVIMRVYAPDLERYETWSPPKAERTE